MKIDKKLSDAEMAAIGQYISRAWDEMDERPDEEIMETADVNINAVLSAAAARGESRSKEAEEIKIFMQSSPVNRLKLLSYVLNPRDAAQEPQIVVQKYETVELNAYLREDELTGLKKFMDKHKKDRSFGQVVYDIMEKHNMTSSQVYNGVFMRRQDFSRVTAQRCESVSRRLAWQIIIGLHCNLREADEVLFSAGYVRRHSKLDLTMEYFIEHGNYDMLAIDAVLENLGIKTFTY